MGGTGTDVQPPINREIRIAIANDLIVFIIPKIKFNINSTNRGEIFKKTFKYILNISHSKQKLNLFVSLMKSNNEH
jgi:hypothetical protein